MSGVAIAVKGWCPGALRPMPSGDGLIVRIRPFCGALTLDQACGLADLAQRLGNGHIDLTRRANLQIRGLDEADLTELHAGLDALGLIDPDVETEATRNLMVGPLAGLDTSTIDVRTLAREVAECLVADPRFRLLSPKFGVLVDGGGPLSIAGERADIALLALDWSTVALGVDTTDGTRWLGEAPMKQAATVATAAIHAVLDVAGERRRVRDLPFDAIQQRICSSGPRASRALMIMSARDARGPEEREPRQGLLGGVVGIAAPFGRLQATELKGLVALAANAGAVDLRLSPWRTLYFKVRDASVLAGARALGLIVDPDDPLLRIDACPGAPDCAASSVDTRSDARWLAGLGFAGRIHVSGCAKGCARSDPADLVLVGDSGGYGVAHNATARGVMERRVSRPGLAALLAEERRG